VVGENEYREGSKELTEVGTTDDNLGPSTDTESALGVSRGEGVLQEPVKVESQSVTGEEPYKTVERWPDEGGDGKERGLQMNLRLPKMMRKPTQMDFPKPTKPR